MNSCIYLDYHASTPIDPAVKSVMITLIEDVYGNPHSEHALGWLAAEKIATARENIASLIGSDPSEVIFTSGATEANNHVIQGILRAASGKRAHVVTSAIEHKSVLETLAVMHKHGLELDIIPVAEDGRIDPELIASHLRENTVLVSIGMANNEIGTIQPISEIADVCHSRGVPFHTDAAQAVGKIPVDVVSDKIDLLSLSGHKIYGPKGIGAIFISKYSPIKPESLILGGSQQDNMRAGTVPTFLCAGLGEACRIAEQRLNIDTKHISACRSLLLKLFRQKIPDIKVNGSLKHGLPGNLNICFPQVDAEVLLTSLQGRVAASTGSACNAGMIEFSHVLRAIGLSSEAIESSIRFGVGRQTTKLEIQLAAKLIVNKVTQFRREFRTAV